MQCCGNTGPENFGTPLPNSCCNVNVLTNGACLTGDNFTRGCKVTLTNLIDDSADLIAAIILAVAGVEVFIFDCKIFLDINIFFCLIFSSLVLYLLVVWLAVLEATVEGKPYTRIIIKPFAIIYYLHHFIIQRI